MKVSQLLAILWLSASLMLTACNYYKERQFATFDLAMQLGKTIENPPVLESSSLPEDLPGGVAYAAIDGDFYHEAIESQAWWLKDRAMKRGLEPDFLVYIPAGSAYSGSVYQYVGYGVGFSTPVYRPQATALCCRLFPVRIGFRFNDSLMVVFVDDEVRSSLGIQEGDTLVSLNGRPFAASGDNRPSDTELLKLKPGDAVKVVWIRPGVGKMEAATTALEPRKMPDDIRDLTAKKIKPKKTSTLKKSEDDW